MTLPEWEAISRGFVNLAVGTVLRSTLLACFCGIAEWLLRRRTAELRYTLWRWMLLSLLALPLLQSVTPPLRRAPLALRRMEAAVRFTPPGSAKNGESKPVTVWPRKDTRNADSMDWQPLMALPGIYLLVALILLTRLGYSVVALRKIAQRSQPFTDETFREFAHQVWLRSGAYLTPRYGVSKEVSAPVTFSADDIWILLPVSWPEWDEAKLRMVLTHEMAHVRRRDSANLLLASITTCILWFHPLSWFLRQRLSMLAEQACDEVVMEESAMPEKYADYLIDSAREVKKRKGRIANGAIAMAGRSSLKRRIERLFAGRPDLRRGRLIFAALAFSIFVPALYLAAAIRLDDPKGTENFPWPQLQQIQGLSPANAANLEATVEANPDDVATRIELLLYYGDSRQDKDYTNQMLWLIQHDPGITTLPMAAGMYDRSKWLCEGSKEAIKAAWEKALADHSNSMDVFYNAASFLEEIEPERALKMFQDAEIINSSNHPKYLNQIKSIYTAAKFHKLHPDGMLNNIKITDEVSERLRQQLSESRDPELFEAVGTLMVELDVRGEGDQTQRGLALIEQALKLDPGNSKWKEALESAKAEPERRLSYQRLRESEPVLEGTVRIGSAIAEAALISKTAPAYPSEAVMARIQGSVEFSIKVGPDGKVSDITLVRGQPLFVEPAKQAVSKWVYQPAVQEGKAIPFLTEVIVPFKLP